MADRWKKGLKSIICYSGGRKKEEMNMDYILVKKNEIEKEINVFSILSFVRDTKYGKREMFRL